VRTTDTGGVKLLYNGVPAGDGSCNNMWEASALAAEQMGTSSSKVAYNSILSSPADVGYMYNKRYTYQTRALSQTETIKYGNNFIWDGANYTLTDTVDSLGFPNDINTHHYTCFNTTGVCNKLNYIYYIYSGTPYYIILADGKSVNDALNEMLYNDDVNEKNSTMKTVIDYWYEHNMKKYTPYLEDTVWCNDRSLDNGIKDINGWNPNGGNTSTGLRFKSYSDTKDLTCKNKSDRFTVGEVNGNGSLAYPVGLIDATEINLTYSDGSPNNSGSYYWGSSPYYFYGVKAISYLVSSDGYLGNSGVDYLAGVRPAVSLGAESVYSSGNGSVDKPYVIITN